MELTDLQIELIEKKFKSQLNSQEKNELDELERNPDFKKEVHSYLSLFESIEDGVQQDLRQKMNSWDGEKIGEKKLEIKSLRKTMKMAAIMLGFMLAVVSLQKLIGLGNDSPSFASYYQAYPNKITTRSNNTPTGNALQYYSDGKYQECFSILDTIKMDDAYFYKAQSLFALENYKDALVLFESNSLQNTQWQSTSDWYSILCKLRIETKEKEGFNALKELSKTKRDYSPNAKALLLILTKNK